MSRPAPQPATQDPARLAAAARIVRIALARKRAAEARTKAA